MKTNYTFYFDFVSQNENQNEQTLQQLTDEIFGGRGSVEIVEKLFDITFASGIENGRPIFLNLDGEDSNNDYLMTKYDGKVLLTTPPLDHQTNEPFIKTKLTFKIEVKEIDNGFEEVKGFINSKLRNTLDF